MPNILIVYFSHGGNTRKMAEAISHSARQGGCSVGLKKVEDATLDDLRSADGVLLGAPCYFGCMANPMKLFIDESIALFGKGELEGKPRRGLRLHRRHRRRRRVDHFVHVARPVDPRNGGAGPAQGRPLRPPGHR